MKVIVCIIGGMGALAGILVGSAHIASGMDFSACVWPFIGAMNFITITILLLRD